MNTALRLALLLLCGAASAQTVYKSVGADGKVVYSDKPPAEGRLEKTMTFESLPSSALPASASSYVEQLRRMHARDAAQPAAALPQQGVVLYTASWCGWCKKARGWLGAQGISYRDIDVESPEGLAEFARVGGGGVPVIVADGRRVAGFSSAAYAALFAQRK
jgi:glutaredoxin